MCVRSPKKLLKKVRFFMKKCITYILIFICIIAIMPKVYADDEDLEEEINDSMDI